MGKTCPANHALTCHPSTPPTHHPAPLTSGPGCADVHGLSLAFASGAAGTADFSGVSSKGVDVLVTSHWPEASDGYFRFVPGALAPSSIPVEPPCESAQLAGAMAAHCRPRYHFVAGGRGMFYQMPPYGNVGATGGSVGTHVTRFVGLGKVSATAGKKGKYLHALNLTPMSTMSAADITARPDGTLPSPYSIRVEAPSAKRQRPGGGGAGGAGGGGGRGGGGGGGPQFFFDVGGGGRPGALNPNLLPAGVPRRGGGSVPALPPGMPPLLQAGMPRPMMPPPGAQRFNNQGPRGPPPPPTDRRTSCWFCLATPEVEKHLIVSIGGHVYLACAKGAIDPHHVLAVPVKHVPCLACLPDDAYEEVDKYKESLKKLAEQNDHKLFVFENHLALRGAQHGHMQMISVPKDSDVRGVVMDLAKANGVEFELITAGTSLSKATGASDTECKPYVFVELPDGDRLLHRIAKDGMTSKTRRQWLQVRL